MEALNVADYKISKPVKKEFDGKAVFVKPDMSALDDIAFRADLRELDSKEEGFGLCFISLIVKHRVVNKGGELLFNAPVKSVMSIYGEAFIGRLYELVVEVIGDPLAEEESASKNS